MKKNNFKKTIKALVLITTSFLILFNSGPGTKAEKILDMPNDWSRDALEKAMKNGLIQGHNGMIRPNDSLKRAEMAVIINRAFGVKKKANLDNFTDVDKDAWYYEDMAKAFAMGTFKGSDGKLNPEKAISREEAFIVIARALSLEGTEWRPNEIRDLNQVSTWARGGVYTLLYKGYISGSNGKINPRAEITRAEFAQLMDNVIKNYIREPGEFIGNIDGNVLVTSPGVRIKDSVINGDIIMSEALGGSKLEIRNSSSIRIVIGSGLSETLDLNNGPYNSIVSATEEFKAFLNKSYMIPIPDLPSGVTYLGKKKEYGAISYEYSYNHSLAGGGRVETITAVEDLNRNYIYIVGKDKYGGHFFGRVYPEYRDSISFITFGPKPEFTNEGLEELRALGVLFIDNRSW